MKFLAVDPCKKQAPHDEEHFARIRRAKKVLRYLPRRAVLHKYPLVGRFADFARRRHHLWSFRREYVTPAFYAGSILALLPLVGLHLPLALVLSLGLRANFMVLGGLQFINNPFTIAPISYSTYHLGKAVMRASGFGADIKVVNTDTRGLAPTDALPVPTEADSGDNPSAPHGAAQPRRLGTTINAFAIGSLIAGGTLGLVLDLAWRFGARQTQRRRDKIRGPGPASDSTPEKPQSD